MIYQKKENFSATTNPLCTGLYRATNSSGGALKIALRQSFDLALAVAKERILLSQLPVWVPRDTLQLSPDTSVIVKFRFQCPCHGRALVSVRVPSAFQRAAPQTRRCLASSLLRSSRGTEFLAQHHSFPHQRNHTPIRCQEPNFLKGRCAQRALTEQVRAENATDFNG